MAVTITGPQEATRLVRVDDGRARFVDDGAADVTITLDFESFARLACGRWLPEEALQSGRVEIDGDEELGRSVLDNMNVMI